MPQWAIRFNIISTHADFFADALVEENVPVTTSELPDDTSIWQVEAVVEHQPDADAWQERLATLAKAVKLSPPSLTIEEIADRDWVSETQAGFPPFSVGRFYVYGSHVKEPAPEGQDPIQVDAGMAFGTGEHATTKGCLQAIEHLATTYGVDNNAQFLDMGCGSGILAMALARCWPDIPILAVDIDEPAVAVTRENAEINKLSQSIHSLCSQGFADKEIHKRAPYQIITANILAGPLIAMAGDIAEHTAPDGRAILSGLLQTQEEGVITAYKAEGFEVDVRYPIGEWQTLLLRQVV